MLLAETAQVEVKNYVNTNQGQSYSVTTTTVNGVTTTQTTNYAPGEPIVASVSASAHGETLGKSISPQPSPAYTITITPPVDPSLSPIPTPEPPVKKTGLFVFIRSLFFNLFKIFHR